MSKQRIHMSLSVDVDRFNDRYLIKHYNGVLSINGRPVQVPHELRRLCAEYRAKGFEAFPPCDNADERGHCQGHTMPDEPDEATP